MDVQLRGMEQRGGLTICPCFYVNVEGWLRKEKAAKSNNA
jgi:hypothetical protein